MKGRDRNKRKGNSGKSPKMREALKREAAKNDRMAKDREDMVDSVSELFGGE